MNKEMIKLLMSKIASLLIDEIEKEKATTQNDDVKNGLAKAQEIILDFKDR